MRCLSPSSAYGIQLFGTGERIIADAGGFGVSVKQREQIHAQFAKSGLMPHEEDLALKSFNFTGLPEGIHPLTRVGVFDTEAYCLDHYEDEEIRNEMQAQIDTRLRELQKKFPTQFIIVETPVAEKPWPSYDEDSVEDILKLQERLGFDPTVVRRYEEENAGRADVIEPMQELEADSAGEAEISVSA
jgi:hypothetical protein